MQRRLLLSLACALLALAPQLLTAQVVLDDFESGSATLPWNAADGTFAVVANPNDSNSVNTSAFVGEYTKDSTKGFSLLLAELDAPIDLGGALQIALDVYATDASAMIIKLEGEGVPAAERRFNIPVANQWRRYVADFSDVAANNYTKIILFFDPGNDTGKGTYYFDNVATEESDCAGTERDALIVDDFECQRSPIRAGFDQLVVIENPDPTELVPAGPVGQYTDQEGGFAAIVYNYENDIDLAAGGQVSLKMWAPVTGRLLVKLEGGDSPAQEIDAQVTEIMTWVEYTFDFSASEGQSFRSLTIFTNAGENGEGDVYYFDDIKFQEPVVVPAFEDFEAAETVLFYQPLAGNADLNGSFAVIANPDQSDANASANVGAYTTGSAAQSTLQALIAEPLDLTATPELSMRVWAPDGATTVRASAVTATGRADVEQTISATMQWVPVSFNFEELGDGLAAVSTFEFVFGGGTAEAGRVFYFDDLRFGAATSDACDDVEVDPNVADDFECQRNATIIAGEEVLRVIDNPDTEGNSSTKVGEYTDPAGAFSALVYEFDSPLDLSVFNRVTAQIWAPAVVPLGFKLEGSQNGAADIEKQVDVTEAMSWQTYRVDFSEGEGGQYTKLVIFFNFGVEPAPGQDVYYIDNIGFSRGPLTGCVTNFEAAQTSITNWSGFAGGSTNDTVFAVVDNPDMSGVNTSMRVGRFSESTDGETFAGIFAPLGAPVLFPDAANKTIRMSVWSPIATDFVMKLEGSATGAGGTGDVMSSNTYDTPGEWQVLTFDFSAFDAEAAQYQQITLIPGIGRVPDALTQIYFDDIIIGDAECAVVSTRTPRAEVAEMRAFPNPVSAATSIVLPEGAALLRVVDGLGRTVRTEAFAAATAGQVLTFDLGALPRGSYTAVAQGRDGRALARVRLQVAR